MSSPILSTSRPATAAPPLQHGLHPAVFFFGGGSLKGHWFPCPGVNLCCLGGSTGSCASNFAGSIPSGPRTADQGEEGGEGINSAAAPIPAPVSILCLPFSSLSGADVAAPAPLWRVVMETLHFQPSPSHIEWLSQL